MTHLLGFAMLLVALVVHEAGHAVAMTRRGIEIEEAGLGLPIGRLKLTLRPRFLLFPIILSPILLGAYVKPSDAGQKKLELMSYKDKAVCYAAGVISNLLFAALMLAVIIVTVGFERMNLPRLAITAAILVVLSVVIVLLRRAISMIVPLLGLAALTLLIIAITQSPDNIGGPIAVVSQSFESSTMFDVVVYGFGISLSLGLFNMVPFIPLDGGRVTQALLEAWGLKTFSKYYGYCGAVIMLLTFVALFGKDIIGLIF